MTTTPPRPPTAEQIDRLRWLDLHPHDKQALSAALARLEALEAEREALRAVLAELDRLRQENSRQETALREIAEFRDKCLYGCIGLRDQDREAYRLGSSHAFDQCVALVDGALAAGAGLKTKGDLSSG